MARIPPLKPRWVVRQWVLDAVIAFGALGTVFFQAWSNWGRQNASGWSWVFLTIGVVVVVSIVWRALLSWKREQLREPAKPRKELVAWANAAHESLKQASASNRPGAPAQFRLAIHAVIEPKGKSDAVRLQQAIDYIGDDSMGAGRAFSARAGIIGLAYRTGETQVFSARSDRPEDLASELVEDWGYLKSEAHARRADRRAWLAVPIPDPSISDPAGAPVVGLIFCDSPVSDCFDDFFVQQAVAQAKGLARLVRETYS
jgi:hypothetical protein